MTPDTLLRFLDVAARDTRVTVRMLLVLFYILKTPGGFNSAARGLQMSPAALSRACGTLCILGYLQRTRDEDDARKVNLTVTDAGIKYIKSLCT